MSEKLSRPEQKARDARIRPNGTERDVYGPFEDTLDVREQAYQDRLVKIQQKLARAVDLWLHSNDLEDNQENRIEAEYQLMQDDIKRIGELKSEKDRAEADENNSNPGASAELRRAQDEFALRYGVSYDDAVELIGAKEDMPTKAITEPGYTPPTADSQAIHVPPLEGYAARFVAADLNPVTGTIAELEKKEGKPDVAPDQSDNPETDDDSAIDVGGGLPSPDTPLSATPDDIDTDALLNRLRRAYGLGSDPDTTQQQLPNPPTAPAPSSAPAPPASAQTQPQATPSPAPAQPNHNQNAQPNRQNRRGYFRTLAAAIDTAHDLFAPKRVGNEEVKIFGELSLKKAISAVACALVGVQTPEVSAYRDVYNAPWSRYGRRIPLPWKIKHDSANSVPISTYNAPQHSWDWVWGKKGSGKVRQRLTKKYRKARTLH